jgi:hypothetical protein
MARQRRHIRHSKYGKPFVAGKAQYVYEFDGNLVYPVRLVGKSKRQVLSWMRRKTPSFYELYKKGDVKLTKVERFKLR